MGRPRSPRWVAGGASRPLVTNTHGDSDAYHPRRGGTCDQRCQAWRPTIGRNADAAPSGSWRRGESPHATTPTGGPGGVEESWAICRQG